MSRFRITSKFQVRNGSGPATDMMMAGTYWGKKLHPDRNTKFVRMVKATDGLWSERWKHDVWDRAAFDLDPADRYMFMGPLPLGAWT